MKRNEGLFKGRENRCDLPFRRNQIFFFLELVAIKRRNQVFLHGIFSFVFEGLHLPKIHSNEMRSSMRYVSLLLEINLNV